MIPFSALIQDIQYIYSCKDQTTQAYQKEYDFEGNKVTIIFKRVWKEKTHVCDVNMCGSADIKMQNRDFLLEEKIEAIIKNPSHRTMLGNFSVVDKINFI